MIELRADQCNPGECNSVIAGDSTCKAATSCFSLPLTEDLPPLTDPDASRGVDKVDSGSSDQKDFQTGANDKDG